MTALTPDHSPLLRFGIYQLDLRTQQLSRSGTNIGLSWQSYMVLTILLEKPGEVVSRTELQRRLWPEGTFVDFEGGLNAAVRRLRVVFRERAASPTYIETLSRRGYRFVAPVTYVAISQTPVQGAEPPQPLIAPHASDWTMVFLTLAVLALLVAVAAGAVAFTTVPNLLSLR